MIQVSVIVINYNTFDLTCNAIKSVFEKTKAISFEVILVDNASVECPPENFIICFPQVRLVKSPINLGFAKGNNLGIQYAKGVCLLLLNSDTVLINDAVSIAYHKLISNKRNGVVGAQLQYQDGEFQCSAQRFPELKFIFIELFRLQKLFPKRARGKLLLGSFFNHSEEVEVDWIWGTFFMFKRELLKKLRGQKLPDDFFMYNEDLQWGIETKKAGFKTVFCPDAKVIHYEGKNKFKSQMAKANFSVIMEKYYGKWYYKLYCSLHRLLRFTLSRQSIG